MSKRYRGMTMVQAVQAAEQEDDPQLLAPNTVNSYLSNLSALFGWALREELVDKNPMTELIDKDAPQVEPRAFTRFELERLFSSLAVHRRSNDWRFWVPALGLYTGARLNELCQLKADDVRTDDGILYFRFTEFDATGARAADKRLKTRPSTRNVPLHPAIIAAGAQKFVEEASSRDRVFPSILPGPDGAYSHEPSKWFGNLLNRLGMADPSLVFHSFRHGFRNACDAADVSPEYRKALGGWASSDVADRYGTRDAVPVLHREISKLTFEGFSLADACGC